MRRLAFVLFVLLLPALLWATPAAFPTYAKPGRAQADLSHPQIGSGATSTPRSIAPHVALGLFGLINAWLDALGAYLQEVAVEEALGILGAILAGMYGTKRARAALRGRRKTDE